VEQHPPQYQGGIPAAYPGEKVGPDGHPSAGYYDHKGHTAAQESALPPPAKESRILGMKKMVFFIVIAALILIIALGVGLGVGLSKHNDKKDEIIQHPFCKDHPEYCIGGNLNAEYYSKKGAFNGSGIALAGESWNVGQRRIFTLFFQHHSGDIRQMQYGTDQLWVGGNKTNMVANDAKNGTTISAVAYTLKQTGWVSKPFLSALIYTI
jgi:hypothetical protein